jgi:DNA-binding response OmpR family regulator
MRATAAASPRAALVVHHDDAIAKTLTDALPREAWEVDATSSGRTVMERVERRKYDVVFLGLDLPHHGSDEILRKLRGRERRPHVIAVAPTSHRLSREERDIIEDVLSPPISAAGVQASVARLTQGSGSAPDHDRNDTK